MGGKTSAFVKGSLLLDICSCLLLSLFWVWNWVAFQSPTSLPLVFDEGSVTIPSRAVSLLAFALTGFGLFAWHRFRPVRRSGTISRILVYAVPVAAACGMLGFDIIDGLFDGEYTSINFLFADVCMGVGGALLYMEFGLFFSTLGAKRYRFVVICCIVSVVVSVPVSMSLFGRGVLRQVLTALILIGSAPALAALYKRYPLYRATVGEVSRIPVKFVVTLLLVGASYGLMQGFFAEWNAVRMMNPLSATGFVVAAVIMACAVFLFKFDFNRLVYQLGFPIFASGFLITALGEMPGHIEPFFGVLLSVAGYRFIEITMWVLCLYLAANMKGPLRWFFALLGGALAFSEAVGLMVFELSPVGFASMEFTLVASVLLVSALYLVTGKVSYEDWGIVKPGSWQQNDEVAQACDLLAVEYFLTAREKDVFLLLAQGRNRKAISEKLVLSENTIKTHASNIYSKLGVHNQQELIDAVEAREGANAKPSIGGEI